MKLYLGEELVSLIFSNEKFNLHVAEEYISNTPTMEEILIDFEYTVNDNGTVTLTAWKQTLNGVPSTEMVIPDDSRIIL